MDNRVVMYFIYWKDKKKNVSNFYCIRIRVIILIFDFIVIIVFKFLRFYFGYDVNLGENV